MITWRARDAFWIPDPPRRGDIDQELSNRVREGNWGVSLEVQQSTRDAPRQYTWGFTTYKEGHLMADGHSISESTMLNICGRPPHTGSWGFTFVRLDP